MNAVCGGKGESEGHVLRILLAAMKQDQRSYIVVDAVWTSLTT